MAKAASIRGDFFIPQVDGRGIEMRCVWPHLAKKRTVDFQGTPLAPDAQYYDASFFIPKTAAAPWECRNYMALAQQLDLVARQAWPGGWPTTLNGREPVRWPISDCDLTQLIQAQPGQPMPTSNPPDYLERNPWARGHWRISCKSTIAPPRMADAQNNPMTVGMDGEYVGFKGGDYTIVSLNVFSYVTGTGGLAFGFEGLKKTRDGDPVGGGMGRSLEQMFGAPTGAPAYGAPAAAPPLPSGYPGQAYAPPPAPAYAPPAPPPAYATAPTLAPAVGSPYGAPPVGFTVAPAGAGPSTGSMTTYPSNAPIPGQPVAPPAYGAPAAYPIGGR